MYPLANRNIGDVERMVVNHSVQINTTSKCNTGSAAVRWYPIRGMAGTPGAFQQGTYSPDTNFRWTGGVAMDKQGNMAAGYSVSSSATQPALVLATRLAAGAPGTLAAESLIVQGGGAQLSNLSR